jgi:hypothetical protein
MQTVPGRRCAAVLIAIGLPFEAIVESLIANLDLTYEEAAPTVLEALLAERARTGGV